MIKSFREVKYHETKAKLGYDAVEPFNDVGMINGHVGFSLDHWFSFINRIFRQVAQQKSWNKSLRLMRCLSRLEAVD